MPSVQLATYLQARADGATVEAACTQSGIGLAEARLTEKAVDGGEIEMPHARTPAPARAREQSNEEGKMARDTETTTTIQVGDGPAVPLSDFEEAANRVVGPSVAADELRLLIERIERLKEEVKGLNEDVADVYTEAKARGYDKATIRRIIRLRAMEGHTREEAAALLETYADAVGLQGAFLL